MAEATHRGAQQATVADQLGEHEVVHAVLHARMAKAGKRAENGVQLGCRQVAKQNKSLSYVRPACAAPESTMSRIAILLEKVGGQRSIPVQDLSFW